MIILSVQGRLFFPLALAEHLSLALRSSSSRDASQSIWIGPSLCCPSPRQQWWRRALRQRGPPPPPSCGRRWRMWRRGGTSATPGQPSSFPWPPCPSQRSRRRRCAPCSHWHAESTIGVWTCLAPATARVAAHVNPRAAWPIRPQEGGAAQPDERQSQQAQGAAGGRGAVEAAATHVHIRTEAGAGWAVVRTTSGPAGPCA